MSTTKGSVSGKSPAKASKAQKTKKATRAPEKPTSQRKPRAVRSKQQVASAKKPDEAKPDSSAAERPSGERRSRLKGLFCFVDPCFVLSGLVHAVALLALALMTLSLAEQEKELAMLAAVETAEESAQEFEEVEIALNEPVDAENIHAQDAVPLAEAPDPRATAPALLDDVGLAELADVGFSDAPEFPPGPTLGRELTGLSGNKPPGEFFGSKVQGDVAVVFDVTASMYVSVQRVLREINLRYDRAQVVVVHGATFKPYGSGVLLPYARNAGIQKYMYTNTSRTPQKLPLLGQVHRQLLALSWCDSLAPEGFLQSLGAAVEALVRQEDGRPGTIFVFSDFQDGVDPQYMQAVAALAKARKVKVVFYHPRRFSKDRAAYAAFAAASGGEVRENLPE